MGILRNALTGSSESRSLTWNDLAKLFTGGKTLAGVSVDERKALTVSAVWSAANILSQNIGTLPLPALQKTEDGRRKADELSVFWVLNKKANAWMTATTYRQTVMLHLALWRVSYSQIERDGAGNVIGLWPLMPDRTRPITSGNDLYFETRLPDNTARLLPSEDVLHILAPSLNGLEAESMVKMARETLGQILAAQEFGSRLYSQGLNTSGFITSESPLDPKQREQVRQQVVEQIQGLQKAHDLLILPFGLKWQSIATDPQKAQMLETREFLITEVARWFNMPPHKLGVMSKGMAYASVEQMQLAFVQETLRPWLVMIEQAMDTTLFTEDQWKRQGYYVHHKVDGLLRADSKTRAEVLHIMRNDGVINANQWRDLEDMNKQDGEQGEVYWMPVNMAPAAELLKKAQAETGDRDAYIRALETILEKRERQSNQTGPNTEERADKIAKGRQRLAHTFRRLIADAMTRIVRREESDVLRKARELFGKRNAEAAQFDKWLDDFYVQHPEFIERHLLPVLLAFAEAMQADAAEEVGAKVGMTPEMEQFAREYLEKFTAYHIGSSKGQLRQVLQKALEAGEDPVGALEERLTEWTETRPGKVADYHSAKAGNFFVKMALVLAGISRIRWNSAGDTCPSCERLHGQVISIQGEFIHQGEEHSQGDGKSPLTASTDVSHPPAHRGCDCFITAG